jgi:hypothetical protein
MSPNADFSSASVVEGGENMFKFIQTFFDVRSEKTDLPTKHVAKRAKLDEGGSIASENLGRVRFRLFPLYQYLTRSRIALTIARASR